MTRAELEARILDRMVSWYALLRNTVPEMTDAQLALLEGHMTAALDLLKDTRLFSAPVHAPMVPTTKEFLDAVPDPCRLCGKLRDVGDVCADCWNKLAREEATISGTLNRKNRRGRR